MFKKLYLTLFLILFFIEGCITSPIVEEWQKLQIKHLEKLTNWIQADASALKYKDQEPAAREYLQQLRTVSFRDVSSKLKADGFHWRQEALDFTNYAWVTIAEKRGDCDDFMILWEAILKYQGETQRVFVCSSNSAHAMLLFTKSNVVFLFSNLDLFAVGEIGKEDELCKKFYKDQTIRVIRY